MMKSDPILVRSSLARWPAFIVGGLGTALVVGGVVVSLLPRLTYFGLALGGLGLLGILIAVIMETRRKKLLMWVMLEEHRFTVRDQIGERTFADDDVVSMALKYKENFENGTLKSITRTFRVWNVTQADQPELVEMVNKLKTGAADPLQSFIERIVTLLKERASGDRQTGRSVLGEKWVLEGKKLALKDVKRGEVEITLGDVAAADYIDDQLKIWRRGVDECCAEIPHESANCHLLKVMLDDELSGRPRSEEAEPPEGQLGRIIFERKPSRPMVLWLFGLGVLLGMVGLILLIAALMPGMARAGADTMLIIGVVLLLLSGGFLLGGAYSRRALFRCQAFGVYQRSLMGETALRYSEMETFTYSATRHYHNGVYTGTQLKMVFNPKPEFKHKKLVYSTMVKNVDSSLDEMRDQIAGMLAGRLVRGVREGQSIEWTPKLTLTPKGVQYIPSSLFSKKPPELLPYEEISGTQLEQGTFSLFRTGQTKAVATEAASARNFFPGWLALSILLAERPTALGQNAEATDESLSS